MAEPKFVPKPGQVDYTDIRYAPVINVVVAYKGKILCLHRSKDLKHYPDYWDWVCGFLDDSKSIEDKAKEELFEEIGIKDQNIDSLTRGRPILEEAPEYKKTWLVIPVLARVNTDKFKIDWESQDAGWFEPEELKGLKLVPNSLSVVSQFFPELV